MFLDEDHHAFAVSGAVAIAEVRAAPWPGSRWT